VEGCILRQDGLESSQTLKRTISFLKEIGCTIDPNVATNACYEGVLFELVCSRDYSEYLKGIHAKPKNCEKTTIVENVIGVERTGGGGVVAAFTYGDTNVWSDNLTQNQRNPTVERQSYAKSKKSNTYTSNTLLHLRPTTRRTQTHSLH